MIKKILVSICLLFSLISFAQEGTSSPYSFYGIGDVKFKGTAESRAMGGLTIFPDSIHLNIQNPASYSNLKYATFTVGGSYSTSKLETESQSEKAQRFSLDYFAVGLPMGKWGASFGLVPYSSVGYKVRGQEVLDGGEISDRRFSGSGGVNRVFVGTGYKISPNFRIGADINYNFGKIQTTTVQRIDSIQFGSREANVSDLAGIGFTLAATYEAKINEKLRFYSGLTYAPQSNLKSSNQREIATIQFLNLGGEIVVDKADIDVDDTTLRIPSKLAFGAGVGELKKWSLGGEVTFQQMKNQSNRFNDIDNVQYENSMKYSIGGFYIPNYNSYSSYLKRVNYRAGLKYETTGLVINGQSIHDASATLGFGLPVAGTFSNINVGFEYGKRGTVAYGLVEENYFSVSIGLSFNDRWFVKRKYD